MKCKIHIQYATEQTTLPKKTDFKKWVMCALTGHTNAAELTLRIVDKAESAALNQQFRHKEGATNVLSFPLTYPPEYGIPYIGDIIICAPLLEEEARAQQKTYAAHWAHLVIHGTLHLLGYDHINPHDAERMESLEINLLNTLGYEDPYGDRPAL